MSAIILDGIAASAAIKDDLTERVATLAERGITPGLGTILIGDDIGSKTYVGTKHKTCAEIGVASIRHDLPSDISRTEVLELIAALNADSNCDGYIIQYPVPGHLDYTELIMAVDPAKDADGLHPTNLGFLALGESGRPRPCTPLGIQALLVKHGVAIEGSHIAIVGRGPTVGRPLAMLLSLKGPNANATITQCHTGTKDLGAVTRGADIVVAATGRAGLITPEMIRPGAAVLDVGISRGPGGIVGDVDPAVAEIAGWLAPMPGGVGPMTVAMLLRNTVEAAERRATVAR